MITYKEEQFGELVTEIQPLLERHWEELANHKDTRPLDPDYERYSELNRLGVLKFFVAREDDKVIGYGFFWITKNLHYKSWTTGLADIYYVVPEKRRTSFTLKFFLNMLSWLKDVGCNEVILQDKTNHAHAKFFQRLGFRHVENIHSKVL